MIKGKNWPIPDSKKIDGSILALKNADKLTQDAQILLQNNKYSSALVLATLALEEFGKHCMLANEVEIGFDVIDSKNWVDDYEDHPTKLKAIPRRLERFLPSDKQDMKRKLEELKHYLASLANKKLQSLYVDWDGKGGEWFDCNDLPNQENDAKEAVQHIEWTLANYIHTYGGDRDLMLTTNSKKRELFRDRKIHCFCDECSTLMMTEVEFLRHGKTYSGHLVGWHWNKDTKIS